VSARVKLTKGGSKAGLPALLLALAAPGLLPARVLAAGEGPGRPEAPASSEAASRPPTPAMQPHRSALGRSRRSTLDARVATLSRALGLDATQQAELRKVLLAQREQVQRIWGDEALPSATRVAMTRDASRRTADEIRALLTPAQRKKYNPPPFESGSAARQARVEDWMGPGAPGPARLPSAPASAKPSGEAQPPGASGAPSGAGAQSAKEPRRGTSGEAREADHGERD
jgi:hypothetical protein